MLAAAIRMMLIIQARQVNRQFLSGLDPDFLHVKAIHGRLDIDDLATASFSHPTGAGSENWKEKIERGENDGKEDDAKGDHSKRFGLATGNLLSMIATPRWGSFHIQPFLLDHCGMEIMVRITTGSADGAHKGMWIRLLW